MSSKPFASTPCLRASSTTAPVTTAFSKQVRKHADITNRLQRFATLPNSLENFARIDRELVKVRFWQAHRSQTLSAEQVSA